MTADNTFSCSRLRMSWHRAPEEPHKEAREVFFSLIPMLIGTMYIHFKHSFPQRHQLLLERCCLVRGKSVFYDYLNVLFMTVWEQWKRRPWKCALAWFYQLSESCHRHRRFDSARCCSQASDKRFRRGSLTFGPRPILPLTPAKLFKALKQKSSSWGPHVHLYFSSTSSRGGEGEREWRKRISLELTSFWRLN